MGVRLASGVVDDGGSCLVISAIKATAGATFDGNHCCGRGQSCATSIKHGNRVARDGHDAVLVEPLDNNVASREFGLKLGRHASERASGNAVARTSELLAWSTGIACACCGDASTMIIANRRIEVVIRHEALAFGGDVVLAILDIRHVQAEFVVRIERRGRRPLNVHTNTSTRVDARVLNFKPRRARSVRVRRRRVGKRLPIRRVIKRSRCCGGDLNSHAARPKRQETRQATHVKVCSVIIAACGLDVLDVTERKRSINREFDVGLNRVYHSRLPARGDGVASAQLRQESSITIRTRGRN
mmetsp:Transcript_5407/g.11914  ORF Transcript_5407/g.11914 Transcript_5407/m.11914 type:complete len:300 (-) Transcript_5407:1113-2012(-)